MDGRWTYWCPSRGDESVSMNELWVGFVNADNEPQVIAAIILPIFRMGAPFQNEQAAKVCRDALSAAYDRQSLRAEALRDG